MKGRIIKMKNIELKIKGMHCTGCSARIEKILGNTEGIIKVQVSFEEKKATIDYDETKITLEEIKKEIEDAGFEVI